MFGAQNCSPIKDDIRIILVIRELNMMVMQLTYNNQSLLACGCYETEDSVVRRFSKHTIRGINRIGMVINMSHRIERGALDPIDIPQHSIVISHANSLIFHDVKRNKSDQVFKALSELGGSFGFNLIHFI